MKQLSGGLLALFLAGCSGASGSSPVGSQPDGAQAALAGVRTNKAARMSPDHFQDDHNHNFRFHGKGGTIEYKPFESYAVVLPYAPNSLGKKGYGVASRGYYDGWMGVGYPNAAPNYTIDWEGAFGYSAPITFDNDDLTMTISGSGLSPQTSYTLFVYTLEPSGGYNLVSQTSLGTPVKGTLSTPSPFEDGFITPKGETVFALEH